MQSGIYFWLGVWKLACEGWGKYEEIGISACTLDPRTNSETANPNFHKWFSQLE